MKAKYDWYGIEVGIMLTLGLLLLLRGGAEFYSGFHNLDNGLNNYIFQSLSNITVCDVANDGKCYTPVESIVTGYDMMFESIRYILGGGIIFGIGVAIAIEGRKK